METLLKHFRALTVNCNNKTPDKIKSKVKNAALVCANSYDGTEKSLGPGPVTDAIRISLFCREHQIPVFSLFDCEAQQFVDFARQLLSDVTDFLLIYFSGHGGQIKDLDGDEDDGKDELFVFVNGYVVDDELIDMVINNKNKSNRCLLLSDCCHSGSIWDLDRKKPKPPPGCLSMAAARDKEEAQQAVTKQGREYGYFTEFLFDIIEENPQATAKDAKKFIDGELKKKGVTQQVVIQTTSDGLLDSPLLPFGKPNKIQSKRKLADFAKIKPPPNGLTDEEVKKYYEEKLAPDDDE